MFEITRAQILVYGAVAVTLLLVGARAIASEGSAPESGAGSVSSPGGGGFEVAQAGGRDVVVDVTGAVLRPGVYRLPVGSRVVDAVERAGGESGRALMEGINRAARLTDGQQVVVPEVSPGRTAAATATASPEGPIALGTATIEQLDTIEGIGPVTAQDIVAFRDQHGGLSSVEQLDQISGIGPATMEALRGRLGP